MAVLGRKARPAKGPFAPELSIIIPAFNEGHRIESGLARLKAAAIRGALDLLTTEIIWVNDGSTDDTGEVATRFSETVPHGRVVHLEKNRGKGAAVRAGVATARGEWICFCDADMSIDPGALPDMKKALATADVAIGSRALHTDRIDYDNPVRTVGGRAFNRVVNRLTGLHLRDTQCGFKAFTSPAARLLFATGSIDRFAFDVELLTRAHQYGLHVTEVPVTWDAIEGSHIRPLADPASMLADLGRSQLGIRIAPPVDGFEVVGGIDPDALLARAANISSAHEIIVVSSGERRFVLCPFLSGAKLRTVLAHLRAALGPLQLRECHLTPKDLSALAPLVLALQR